MLFDLLLSYYCEKLYFIRQQMPFNIGYSIIKTGFYNLIVGYDLLIDYFFITFNHNFKIRLYVFKIYLKY